MFNLWSVHKARYMRRKFSNFRAACLWADKLEKRTGLPVMVLWP